MNPENYFENIYVQVLSYQSNLERVHKEHKSYYHHR